MATAGVPTWSTTAATNSTADPAVNWAEGQAPSSVNDSARAMMASVAKWRNDLYGLTTAGTSTAYTVTTNATYVNAAAMSNAVFCIIPNATSGASPTLAVDGLTARAINVSTGVAIPTGALVSGTPYFVKYVHASTEFILLGAVGKSTLAALDIIGGTSLTAIATDDTLPLYDLSGTANKRMLVSDFLKVINQLTADASPDGAADYVMTYDNSASAAKKVLLQNLPGRLPLLYKAGLGLSNSTGDALNDITIAAGKCRDSTDTVDIIGTAKTKQLDANWAFGGGQGFRNSGAGITNTTYHIYAVAKADGTSDYYAHASTTVATVITALQAETGGADYLYARRIGSIIRSGGSIVPFSQKENLFTRDLVIRSFVDTDPGTAAVTATLDVPNGIPVDAVIDVVLGQGSGDSNQTFLLVTALTETNSAPTSALFDLMAGNSNVVALDIASRRRVMTNTSKQIRYRLSRSTGSMTVTMFTRGWWDFFVD